MKRQPHPIYRSAPQQGFNFGEIREAFSDAHDAIAKAEG